MRPSSSVLADIRRSAGCASQAFPPSDFSHCGRSTSQQGSPSDRNGHRRESNPRADDSRPGRVQTDYLATRSRAQRVPNASRSSFPPRLALPTTLESVGTCTVCQSFGQDSNLYLPGLNRLVSEMLTASARLGYRTARTLYASRRTKSDLVHNFMNKYRFCLNQRFYTSQKCPKQPADKKVGGQVRTLTDGSPGLISPHDLKSRVAGPNPICFVSQSRSPSAKTCSHGDQRHLIARNPSPKDAASRRPAPLAGRRRMPDRKTQHRARAPTASRNRRCRPLTPATATTRSHPRRGNSLKFRPNLREIAHSVPNESKPDHVFHAAPGQNPKRFENLLWPGDSRPTEAGAMCTRIDLHLQDYPSRTSDLWHYPAGLACRRSRRSPNQSSLGND